MVRVGSHALVVMIVEHTMLCKQIDLEPAEKCDLIMKVWQSPEWDTLIGGMVQKMQKIDSYNEAHERIKLDPNT